MTLKITNKYLTDQQERFLPETQRKCLPCNGSSISINSTSLCFPGRNKTLCISSLRRDDITGKGKRRIKIRWWIKKKKFRNSKAERREWWEKSGEKNNKDDTETLRWWGGMWWCSLWSDRVKICGRAWNELLLYHKHAHTHKFHFAAFRFNDQC